MLAKGKRNQKDGRSMSTQYKDTSIEMPQLSHNIMYRMSLPGESAHDFIVSGILFLSHIILESQDLLINLNEVEQTTPTYNRNAWSVGLCTSG